MEKKNVILLTVIAVATLLITVVGATFAFFSMTPEGVEEAEEVTIQAANGLTLTFDDGKVFTVEHIVPGWGTEEEASGNTKTVKVKNDTDAVLSYDLEWTSISNSFSDKTNFQYSLAVTASGEKTNTTINTNNFDFKAVPSAAEKIAQEVTINPHEEQTYVFTFKYLNQNESQGIGGYTFEGILDVLDSSLKVSSPTEG